MLAFFYKKNRKGVQWLTSETIIFFFGAILLIATIAFFFRLQSAVFADEDDGSKANLKRLNEEIKELLGTSYSKDYKIINYFIGEHRMLLGFDRDANGGYTLIAASGDIMFSVGPVYKPFDCGNSACLCLYDGAPSHETAKRDQGVLRCEREGTGKNLVFSGSNIFKIGNLESLTHRTKHIYIEKTEQPKGTYNIYINVIDTSDPNDEANKRKIGIDASI